MTKVSDIVVFLYVNSFRWISQKERIIFGGLPKDGRVYKAIKSPETGMYKLNLPRTTDDALGGILVHDLKGEFERWECDIIELDDNLMAEMDICNEDLDMIADELINNNFAKEIESEREPEFPEIKFNPDGSMKVPEEYTDIIAPATSELKELSKVDPLAYKVLVEFTAKLAIPLLQEGPDDFASKLLQENDKLGMGGNMGLALWYLQSYITSKLPAQANKTFLTMSAYFIFLELIRLQLNDTDD